MDELIRFFAHLHPAWVHLPIGMLTLAVLFDLLSYVPGFKKMKVAVRPALFFGNVGALLAVGSGYLLASQGSYDETHVLQHQVLGISTLIFGWLLFFFRHHTLKLDADKQKRKQVRSLLFAPLILLLILTGHKGGVLTHGEDYLFPEEEPAAVAYTGDPKEALMYGQVIAPILHQKCETCHGASKQKGQLRLDSPDNIRKGGKHGTLIAGLADSSLLLKRIHLPVEDEKHMPPRQKNQLTSAEMDLFKLWVMDGTDFARKVKELPHANEIARAVQATLPVKDNLLPSEEIAAADEKALQALRKLGVLVLPMSAGSNYLQLSFINVRKPDNQIWQQLDKLADHIAVLDLAYTSVGDAELSHLEGCIHLRKLSLRSSQVTAKGLIAIATLPELRQLNLMETHLGEEALPVLQKLAALEDLYVYQSGLSSRAVRQLASQRPKLRIDTGHYQLPKLVTDTLEYHRKQ